MGGASADRDPARLVAVLADDVHLRALLPAGLVDLTGRDALLGEFHRWFDGMDLVRVADATAQPFSDRTLLHYELEVAKDDRRWIVAQTVVSMVKRRPPRNPRHRLHRVPPARAIHLTRTQTLSGPQLLGHVCPI